MENRLMENKLINELANDGRYFHLKSLGSKIDSILQKRGLTTSENTCVSSLKGSGNLVRNENWV